MKEWGINDKVLPIKEIQVDPVVGEDFQALAFRVGQNGVTKIEPFEKSGMQSFIPYVRVWINGKPHSEYCQHQIVGVIYQ